MIKLVRQVNLNTLQDKLMYRNKLLTPKELELVIAIRNTSNFKKMSVIAKASCNFKKQPPYILSKYDAYRYLCNLFTLSNSKMIEPYFLENLLVYAIKDTN